MAPSFYENDSLKWRKRLIVGGLVMQQTASTILEYHWWWKDDYHRFNFESDGGFNNYSLGVDKIGHLYTSYFYYHAINEVMKYGNCSKKSRRIVSIAMPAIWALSVEIGDGFSSYNFSPEDLLANFIGIGYGVLQDEVPYLNNFKIKFGYFPSNYFRNNQFRNWSLTSDYNGHLYWFTADVHSLLNKPYKKYWPKGLNLGFAYGVDGFTEVDQLGYWVANRQIQRKFVIGLDWNLGAIQTKKQSVKTVLNIADYIHLPAPGIRRINPNKTNAEFLLLN
ncbi:MAG: DUF2279 domain-containing protein [Bacteroidia bacterium]